MRVATKYPNIARRHYAARGINADVVHLNGAMELAPGLGLTRLIVDLVADRLHAEGQRAGGDRGDRPRHQPPDRQPHRAEDPARADRRLDRPLPRGAGDRAHDPPLHRRRRLRGRASRALLDQARETTETRRRGGRRHHRRRARRAATRRCSTTPQRFDRMALTPDRLRIGADEIDAAVAAIPAELHAALDLAATRIEAFHRAQLPADLRMTDAEGLTLGMRWTRARRGRALCAGRQGGLSVVGADERHPGPRRRRGAHRHVRADAGRRAQPAGAGRGAARRRDRDLPHRRRPGGRRAGLRHRHASPPVDRIVGPGNAYVAEAKRQVFGRVGIDSIAGPSEVVVIADAANDPRRVAIDLLAQAEHDEAAQSILITDDAALRRRRRRRGRGRTAHPAARRHRRRIAGSAHGAIIVVRDWDEAAALADRLAPEHLQIMTADPARAVRPHPPRRGGVPRRLLPGGAGRLRRRARTTCCRPAARRASPPGLSVFDFLKRTTWIAATTSRARRIGPAAVALAEAEGLQAHARSIARAPGQCSEAPPDANLDPRRGRSCARHCARAIACNGK